MDDNGQKEHTQKNDINIQNSCYLKRTRGAEFIRRAITQVGERMGDGEIEKLREVRGSGVWVTFKEKDDATYLMAPQQRRSW